MTIGQVAQPAAMTPKHGKRSLPFVGATLPLQIFLDAPASQLGNAAVHCGRPRLHLCVGARLELNLRPDHVGIVMLSCLHVNASSSPLQQISGHGYQLSDLNARKLFACSLADD